ERFGSLQPVSCNRDNSQVIRFDSALLNEFLCDRHRYSSRSFGKNAFALCEQSYAGENLFVGHIIGPASASGDQPRSVITISWIPGRQRLGDRGGLHRLDVRRTAFYRGSNWIAAGGLSSEQSGPHFTL